MLILAWLSVIMKFRLMLINSGMKLFKKGKEEKNIYEVTSQLGDPIPNDQTRYIWNNLIILSFYTTALKFAS